MKNKIYLSYKTRLIITITSIIVSVIIGGILFANSFNLFEKNTISYKESNNIH